MPVARIVTLLLASVLLQASCRKPPLVPNAAELPPVTVSLATVRREILPVSVEITGSVRAVQRATLAAKVMGTVGSLPIALGQKVRAGELMVQLHAPELAARVLQAQSQSHLISRELVRERQLYDKGAGTQDSVRSLEDRLATADGVLREAEALQSYTTVLAPFDGVVSRRLVDGGDLATPGKPLVELEGTDALEVDADIPETMAPGLAVGSTVVVDEGTRGAFTGSVSERSAAADRTTRSIPLKISVPHGIPLHPGQFVRVSISQPPAAVVLVPTSAVTAFGQIERVFVAERGHAALRLVKTGGSRSVEGEPYTEIVAGLDDGEKVVVNPSPGLRNGQALSVQP